ncbi:glutathione S-transferase family protein [Pelagibacterium sp. H642]|uniref:glutathione S-transferase family protein n=1 Tax=Pelagibacterium sp. H642 TaxID=1881069 RepID=UPI002814FCC3|nr:glutathione S-transferase family protein [Pelagibacterium sp. H642]WMT91508.1 glutathione S-transferase family protein [Pelagibacterium sp. H642]
MSIKIYTYDWVPGGKKGPSGFVRDLRLRWACEEAGIDYEVRTVPFDDRGPEHRARQPFAQIPFLDDEGVRVFESGACLLHLAKKSDKLMPRDAQGEADVTAWVIAALNSIEMVSVPWWFIGLSGVENNPLEGWLKMRLEQLEAVLAEREWLVAGRFTVADILMADVLRVRAVRNFGHFPALAGYLERTCARPAFKKAYADQVSHFAQADERREQAGR